MLAPEWQLRIDEIAADRVSGASEILERAVALLAEALAVQAPVSDIARALCRAQPSMASIWNAALHAVAARDDPQTFHAFAARVSRSARGVTRWALDTLAAHGVASPLRLVTVSFSRTVALSLTALAATRDVRVACAEGRPSYEGRRLATWLAEAGLDVTFFSDAALATTIDGADAVIVGADAVTPQAVINKCGTRMLSAAAAHRGLPVHVLASLDKFVTEAVSQRLEIREGAPEEIWPGHVTGITVRNPYFEPTPLDLITSVITDAGVLGAALVPDACAARIDDRWLAELLESRD